MQFKLALFLPPSPSLSFPLSLFLSYTGSLMLWLWQCSKSFFLSQHSCFKGHPPIYSQVRPEWVVNTWYNATFVFDDLFHTSSDRATVDVTVHLEQSNEPTPPTNVASHSAHPPQSSLSKAPPTSAASGSKVTAMPPHSSHSARRNLTRSFEEVSLNTPSSKTTTG